MRQGAVVSQRKKTGCARHNVLFALSVLGAIAMAVPALAHDTVYYFMTDALHSTVVVTDQNRNIVEETHYGPYGLVLNRQLRDGPGYAGHEEDPATGLVYMQQRYYDPQAGRFLSVDPVGVEPASGGNFNRYWYAKDNPYRYTDPDGRCAGGMCDQMVQSVGESISDSGSTTLSPVAKVGLTVMLAATGVEEAAGVVGAARVAVRYVGAKIAGTVTRRAAAGAEKSVKEQAADLVSQNGGKNRVTIQTPSHQIDVDLAGKSHAGVETPHVKVSERNLNAPKQPAYNTKSAQVRPATQKDIDVVKHHLDKEGQ